MLPCPTKVYGGHSSNNRHLAMNSYPSNNFGIRLALFASSSSNFNTRSTVNFIISLKISS